MVNSRTNTGNSGFGKKAGLPSGRMSGAHKRRANRCQPPQPHPNSIRAIRDFFRTIDTDNSGYITIKEYADVPARLGLGTGDRDLDETLAKIFITAVDSGGVDGDGKMSFDEFVTFRNSDREHLFKQGVLRLAFKMTDTNNDNDIDAAEFRKTNFYINIKAYMDTMKAELLKAWQVTPEKFVLPLQAEKQEELVNIIRETLELLESEFMKLDRNADKVISFNEFVADIGSDDDGNLALQMAYTEGGHGPAFGSTAMQALVPFLRFLFETTGVGFA